MTGGFWAKNYWKSSMSNTKPYVRIYGGIIQKDYTFMSTGIHNLNYELLTGYIQDIVFDNRALLRPPANIPSPEVKKIRLKAWKDNTAIDS